jgi:uncharacterized membrane protein
MIEETLKSLASYIALAIECAAVLVVAYGAGEALLRAVLKLAGGRTGYGWRRDIWINFGIWLLVGLQFALAADIVRSVISPTWTDIGQLAAIAAIRTFLNYFLEKDIETMLKTEEEGPPTGRAQES